ncbi:MAG: ABC transporter ATP-binding protein, partial [Proteobacteria bacterium]|nr:ABC transporter ATP-binding protein [Pseudomonadota bacterium]
MKVNEPGLEPRGTRETPLLEVKDLFTRFPVEGGTVRAVDGVSFTLNRGEVLCLVGESGCGKSMTALSILDLVPPPGRVAGGEVLFEGVDLRRLDRERVRKLRGDRISMVFQEPMSSLNPVFTAGDQVSEVLRYHRQMGRSQAMAEALRLLKLVGIPDPDRRLREYPHQMSGGMQQRILIAMAMACDPELIIADEPTTALDVTVQAQILRLLEELIRRKGRSLLLITHDLGVVARMADSVCVMYAGVIVEKGGVRDIFSEPRHPYTIGLMNSLPTPGRREFRSIPGTVPDLASLPGGCRFHPRCPRARETCVKREPDLVM